MATYVYETIPSSESEQPERFEIQQSMNDNALTVHPENGKPVQRVISGGYGFSVSGSTSSAPAPHSCGGGSCGCHD